MPNENFVSTQKGKHLFAFLNPDLKILQMNKLKSN